MKTIKPNETIYIYFNTTDAGGAPIAPSSAFVVGDFAIHKNGSATEKSTTNGITVTSPFDSETGFHILAIDTSNSTGDAGFWESNSTYVVRFNTSTTVDGVSIDGRVVPNSEFKIETKIEDIPLRPANIASATSKSISGNDVQNGRVVIVNPLGNITAY